MSSRYILLAIPLFFFLMAIELWHHRRRGHRSYRMNDAMANLGCGIGSQVFGVLLASAVLAAYVAVHEYVAPWHIPTDSVWAWLGLLLAVDFCYYVFHRASHRVGFLWATHAVHHQSEEYNLSVALRQAWFGSAFSWVFYLPLVALGFSPVMVLTMRTLNTLYQFWIHTESVTRLGFLESFLNTPSHHRVHHGVNDAYLDKNYAGIFIIWDRLLGTFIPENEKAIYGTVKPLASFSPLWANVAEWVRLAKVSWSTPGWGNKLQIWLRPPGWSPGETMSSSMSPQREKFDVRNPVHVRRGVFVSFLLSTAGLMAYLHWQESMTWLEHGAAAAVFIITLAAWGVLLNTEGPTTKEARAPLPKS